MMLTTNSKGETSIVISFRGVTVERIKELSDTDIGKPSEFCVHLSRLNLGIVDAVIQVLQDFGRRQVVWENFTLVMLSQISRAQQDCVLRLLYVVHSLQLCDELKIRRPVSFVSQSLRDLDHTLFVHGILENTRLKRLWLSVNINQCPPRDVQTLCTILETRSQLQELHLQFSGLQQYDVICSALATNRSLKKLMLLYKDGATEEAIVHTVLMLSGHSTLRSLHLSSHMFGATASQAIEELLANSTIQELCLFAISKEPILNPANIINGVAQNTSLSSLMIGSLEAFDGPEILPLVLQKPNFQVVEIILESIPDCIFDEMLSMDRRRRPLVLILTRGVMLQHGGRLSQLLEKHPELRLKTLNVPLDKTFKRISELNWFGRYLMDRPDTPLSLWPIVLGQSGISHDAVYEMLKGQPLLGRGKFDSLP